MKHKYYSFFVLIIILLAFSSCTPLKEFVYFQGIENGNDSTFPSPQPYRIQPNDNLYIQVLTSDEVTGKYFNISSNDRYLNNESAIELGSYKVDEAGAIDLPLVGPIEVQGKTTTEIKALVEVGVSKYLEQASVIVKHVNRHFSVLGEVSRPGTYSMYNDRISIFEALGYAGDLSDYGSRLNVKLLRHKGIEKEVVQLDLTQKELIYSPYYYIMPNDIIYVEPVNRIYGSKSLPVGTILTAVNTAVLLYNVITNLVRTDQ